MSEQGKIPVLTDLIVRGIEITLSDLGLDDESPAPSEAMPAAAATDEEIELGDVDMIVDPFAANPALEATVRRILDEHMELAWQEIKLAIQQELMK